MEKLKNIIKYFLLNQQRSKETYVELARVGLFLYLVDWHYAVKQDKIVTGIKCGLTKNRIQDSEEIEKAISDNTMFELGKDETIPLPMKTTIKYINQDNCNNFTVDDLNVFNRVIEISDERNIVDLLIFALSTYPVISGTDEPNGNILGKAIEYKRLKQDHKK